MTRSPENRVAFSRDGLFRVTPWWMRLRRHHDAVHGGQEVVPLAAGDRCLIAAMAAIRQLLLRAGMTADRKLAGAEVDQRLLG